MVTTHFHVLCKSVFWVFYHLLLCISLLHCITLSYLLNPCLIASTPRTLFGSSNSVADWHQPCLFLDETVRVSWYRKTLSGLSLYECWMIYFTPMDLSNDCSILIYLALLRPRIFEEICHILHVIAFVLGLYTCWYWMRRLCHHLTQLQRTVWSCVIRWIVSLTITCVGCWRKLSSDLHRAGLSM